MRGSPLATALPGSPAAPTVIWSSGAPTRPHRIMRRWVCFVAPASTTRVGETTSTRRRNCRRGASPPFWTGTLSRASVASRMPVRVGHPQTADRILLEVEFDQDDRFLAHDPAVVSPWGQT